MLRPVPTPMASSLRTTLRRLRVSRGLAGIERHEQVGERVSHRLTAPARRRAAAKAERSLQPLRRWEKISDRSFSTYTGGASAVRMKRLIELIPRGSRVLDIGIGYGYVTGIVLREVRPSYYCGVDLREGFLSAARDMIATNDLGEVPVELEILNVFEISEEFARRHEPDVVLLLEVLEHVEDPAGALRGISEVVRPGTKIIFTVPLLGRLDGVWGHASVFDRRRLEAICEQVGLRIEQAEPLYDTWSLIVCETGSASAEPAPSQEAAAAASPPGYTFRPVGTEGPAEVYRRPGETAVAIETSSNFVRCRIPPGGRNGPLEGGLRLEMNSPRVSRMELSIEPPAAARRLQIIGVDESEATKLEWAGDISGQDLDKRTTYVFKPGRRTRLLKPGDGVEHEGVRWMDVVVEPEPETEVTLTVHRAAYLPDG